MRGFLTTTVFLCVYSGVLGASRLEGAIEQKCFDIKNKVAIDPDFLASFDTIFYPLMSKYEMYHLTSDLLGDDFEKWPEGGLYYDNCMTWKMFPNGTAVSTGFNGRRKEYTIKPSATFDEFEFWPTKGDGYKVKGYTTMTDNKSYMVFPACTADGHMAYGVGAKTPTLPKETIEEIRKHVESLGFKKEFHTELRYDGCDVSNEISKNKDEL